MIEDANLGSERLPVWKTYLVWSVFSVFATIHIWLAVGYYVRQAFPDPEDSVYLDHALSTAVLSPNKTVKETGLRRLERTLDSLHYRSYFQSLLYIEVRNELGEGLSNENVHHLLDGGRFWSRYGKAFQMAFSPQKSSSEDNDLLDDIPYKAFAYRLARVQVAEQYGIPKAREHEFHQESKPIRLVAYTLMWASGLALLVFYVVQKRRGRIVRRGHPLTPTSPADRDRLIIRACQFMALELVFDWPLRYILPPMGRVQWLFLWGMILPAALFLTAIPVAGKTIPLNSYFSFSGKSILRLTLWGAGAALIYKPITYALVAIAYPAFNSFSPLVQHPAAYDMTDHSNWPLIAINLYLAVVMAPIYEELLFRGSMLPALASVFNGRLSEVWARRLGIALSALVFCLGHPYGLAGWIDIGVFAILQSLLVLETGSVYPAIVAHLAYNGLLELFRLSGPH